MRKILIIILGVLLVMTGLMLITRPLTAFSTLGYVMGAALLVNGIANIIIWFRLRKTVKMSIWYLISSIISVIFAFAIFGDVFFKIAVEMVLVYMTAIWFIVTGIMRIVLSFNMKKEGGEVGKHWWLLLIVGILLIICGCMSIANPLILIFAIGLNLGINMLFCGIDLITLSSVVD